MRGARIVAIGMVSAVIAIVAFPTFLSLRGAGTAAYEPERFDYVLLGGAIFGIALGAQVVPWRRAPYIALLAMLGAGFLLFGVLAAFSIGVAFLPAGVVLLLLLFRAMQRRAQSAPAALGGALVGFAAVLLYVAQAVPATAECFPNGASTSSNRWPGGESGGGYATSGGIGGNEIVMTGRGDGRSVVTFRCESGRLVDFQRSPR